MCASVVPSPNGLLATSAASPTATGAVDVTERAEPVFTAVARMLTVTFAVPEDPARSDQVKVALSPPARPRAGAGPPTTVTAGESTESDGESDRMPPPPAFVTVNETVKVSPRSAACGAVSAPASAAGASTWSTLDETALAEAGRFELASVPAAPNEICSVPLPEPFSVSETVYVALWPAAISCTAGGRETIAFAPPVAVRTGGERATPRAALPPAFLTVIVAAAAWPGSMVGAPEGPRSETPVITSEAGSSTGPEAAVIDPDTTGLAVLVSVPDARVPSEIVPAAVPSST